jgi:hypothetical protein|tara:strand:- start:140 stop:352 length:213 start_codon:yes stop_codon:yes gene_type:complete
MTKYIYSTVEIKGRQVEVRRLAPEPEATPEPEIDYAELTKKALIALAEERSVEVSSRMTKAQIIAALEGA